MSEIKKVKVSELPKVENPKDMGFSIFGYRISNKKHESIQVPWNSLIKVVEDAAKNVQLERRIIVTFERPQQLIPMGEKVEIGEIVARNIVSLKYKENKSSGVWTEIPINTKLEKSKWIWNGDCDIILEMESNQKDVSTGDYAKYSTVTIFAKKVNE